LAKDAVFKNPSDRGAANVAEFEIWDSLEYKYVHTKVVRGFRTCKESGVEINKK
jgi:hypothetical protein